ncbi:alpha/beta hydrolase-fold protein [Alicyclobacillus fastidiosus]|uniref:Alpha/beta hydrolase-fold protein n=1 Tax=Alicyclobacillus fastidiosus TaxID=392011 RepID=A0ABY6ZHV3_9BACL|nr:alpha/beta hydrolase-fold protein [Alicyclobacillus fastidiosus]WAH41711.1 alpha/beta hydrolase-fold protein [Alicyclobacillus fastidiosus]GMA63391.1 hypothetical protein GCM10025859_38310 [Alicyclobacillus fastidiosus]
MSTKKLTALFSLVGTMFTAGCSSPNPEHVVHAIATNVLHAPARVQHVTFYSEALHARMKMSVYLPPGYNAKTKYPVLYVLHGKGGNEYSFMTSLVPGRSVGIDKDATELIDEHKIRPLIIVAPELDNSYGVNTGSYRKDVRGYSRGDYSTYLETDVVHYVDSHYSTVKTADGRYIGGLSMGGFAALHAAFTRPTEYSKVGVMSAALWVGGLPRELSWIYPTAKDQAQRDPITIAEHTRIRMPVDIIEGKQDPFYSADVDLYRVLKAQSADVSLHTYRGAHNYIFWRSHAKELLLFFDATPAAASPS